MGRTNGAAMMVRMVSVLGSGDFLEWFDGLLDHDQDAVSVVVDQLHARRKGAIHGRWTTDTLERNEGPNREA